MPELQIGNKVRIKYWNELPELPDNEWNEGFFKIHSGRVGKIIDIVGTRAYLKIEANYDYKMQIDINAITKLNIVPDELFEI